MGDYLDVFLWQQRSVPLRHFNYSRVGIEVVILEQVTRLGSMHLPCLRLSVSPLMLLGKEKRVKLPSNTLIGLACNSCFCRLLIHPVLMILIAVAYSDILVLLAGKKKYVLVRFSVQMALNREPDLLSPEPRSGPRFGQIPEPDHKSSSGFAKKGSEPD
jgi:hypothetical protein